MEDTDTLRAFGHAFTLKELADTVPEKTLVKPCEEGKVASRYITREGRIEELGLTKVFKGKSNVVGSRAAFISSNIDWDLQDRQSFADKDEVVLLPECFSEKDAREWLNNFGVGWACKKGLKPHSANQDSFSVLVVEGEFALYGVYDGHGDCGEDVSGRSCEEIVKRFIMHPKRGEDNEVAFKEAFRKTHEELESDPDALDSGSTCTMAYHDFVQNTLTTAHVGDSRCVLGRRRGRGEDRVKDMTIDHKPDLPEERKRIVSANPPGRVFLDDDGEYRVCVFGAHYPGLNMSRVLGDTRGHKEAGLTSEPDVTTINLRSERCKYGDLTLIICSDGVWDFVHSREAYDMAVKAQDAASGVESIADTAYKLWVGHCLEGEERSDDITVLLVSFQGSKGNAAGGCGGCFAAFC